MINRENELCRGKCITVAQSTATTYPVFVMAHKVITVMC